MPDGLVSYLIRSRSGSTNTMNTRLPLNNIITIMINWANSTGKRCDKNNRCGDIAYSRRGARRNPTSIYFPLSDEIRVYYVVLRTNTEYAIPPLNNINININIIIRNRTGKRCAMRPDVHFLTHCKTPWDAGRYRAVQGWSHRRRSGTRIKPQ